MTRRICISLLFATAFAAWLSCKKAYQPKVVATANNYLVVEATIDPGADPTIVRLSRTVPLSSKANATPETGAIVNIVSDANVSYPVTEAGNGYYQGVPVNGSGTAKYSLKITTKNGESYQSDFVAAKNSPPIDSVYYKVKSDGIDIYADSHDPANNSKYYRWDFTDTYVFTSAFNSTGYFSQIPQDTVLYRPIGDQIHQCWRSDTSTSILINSTAKLTNDVVADNLITTIASTSEKIAHRYTIQVNQYVLTPEAYSYYQQLKKNTEQIGSIFDPQPSELPGNIHCLTNPSETVIGYVTAGTPSKSRIFIDNRKLPGWIADNRYAGCFLDTDLYQHPLKGGGFNNDVAEFIYTGIHVPVLPIAVPMGPIIGWSAGSPFCVDCTLYGTNKRPDYWTDL